VWNYVSDWQIWGVLFLYGSPYFFPLFHHLIYAHLFVLLHIYSDCFESNPLASSLGITSRQHQWLLSSPFQWHFWSLDSPPTWQAPDSQGWASGHSSQIPLPPVSHRGWHQGMSFFMRFCSRWNATRIRITNSFGAWAPFWDSSESACQKSLSDISSWQSTASQRHHNLPISPVILALATPFYSYSPQARSPLINNLLK